MGTGYTPRGAQRCTLFSSATPRPPRRPRRGSSWRSRPPGSTRGSTTPTSGWACSSGPSSTTAIRNSRAMVLVWSEPASRSRWVSAEILTAFHMDRYILPCVTDDTPLPQFFGHPVYLDHADRHRRRAPAAGAGGREGPGVGQPAAAVRGVAERRADSRLRSARCGASTRERCARQAAARRRGARAAHARPAHGQRRTAVAVRAHDPESGRLPPQERLHGGALGARSRRGVRRTIRCCSTPSGASSRPPSSIPPTSRRSTGWPAS